MIDYVFLNLQHCQRTLFCFTLTHRLLLSFEGLILDLQISLYYPSKLQLQCNMPCQCSGSNNYILLFFINLALSCHVFVWKETLNLYKKKDSSSSICPMRNEFALIQFEGRCFYLYGRIDYCYIHQIWYNIALESCLQTRTRGYCGKLLDSQCLVSLVWYQPSVQSSIFIKILLILFF